MHFCNCICEGDRTAQKSENSLLLSGRENQLSLFVDSWDTVCSSSRKKEKHNVFVRKPVYRTGKCRRILKGLSATRPQMCEINHVDISGRRIATNFDTACEQYQQFKSGISYRSSHQALEVKKHFKLNRCSQALWMQSGNR